MISRSSVQRHTAQGRSGASIRRRRSRLRWLTAGSLVPLATALSWWMLPALARADSWLTPISPPTISGTAQVGQTLTEGPAVWSVTPFGRGYQWEDCDPSGHQCQAIDNASNQTYVVAPSDVGHTLRVQETALARDGDFLGQALSAATALVSNPSVPVVRGSSTTTSLTALESSAVTDQIVTLIATVTSSSPVAPLSGTLTFEDGGAPIGGCQNEPILPTGQSVTVTCQTTFAASTAQLTAAFTPAAGSLLGGSASPPDTLAVQPAPTATSVNASAGIVHLLRSVTYTATVRSSYLGPLQPSQTVGFFDNGQSVPSCTTRPLVWTGTAGVATCSVSYTGSGQHAITAQYAGDANFTASTSSPAQLVDAVAGRTHPMLSWTFYYTPAYTKVVGLMVGHVLRGTRVLVTCAGRGCPRASRTILVRRSTLTADGVSLMPLFGGHRLRPGTVVVVSVQRRGLIGKRYVFSMRSGRAPRVSIGCQAPGMAPGVGC